MIGTVLDKFEVLQKIGEGGMATVYRGRHTSLGRDVAIKVLHPHLSRSGRNRQRFAREARAIEHLSHQNILEIFDYSGTDVDDCYIVTEFVDGANLQQLVAEHGRLPSEVVSQIGLQLTSALDYAHSLGIIHRDLKPENVMLRRDGTIKLMDFGIARFLDDVQLTLTGALVGSPAYMSPEQAMEKVLDIRSDLFSLGTLLFHLVTGELPFSGTNPSIILRNIIDGNRADVLALAPATGAQLAETIEHLLQTDPDLRPQAALQVHQALESEMAALELSPAPQGWEVRDWLEDPQNYEERRQSHLHAILLEKGKEQLKAGQQLDALRLLNRLLAMDEDNEEVLQLIRGMHDFAEPEESPRQSNTLLFGLATIAAAAGLTYLLWPDSEINQSPDAAKASEIAEPSGPELRTRKDASQQSAPSTQSNRLSSGTSSSTPSPAVAPSTVSTASDAVSGADPDPGPANGAVVSSDESDSSTPDKRDSKTTNSTIAANPNTSRPDTQPLPSASASNPISESRDDTLSTLAVNVDDSNNDSSETEGSQLIATEAGFLTITIANLEWGDIYIDGQHRGRTGRDYNIAVSPGPHHVRVANGQFRSAEAQVNIVSGEPFELNLPALWPNPATAALKGFADDCTVHLDQTILGTVQALGNQFQVQRPDQVHNVQIICGSETYTEKLEGHAALSTIVIEYPGP